jgi:hypothetical protein
MKNYAKEQLDIFFPGQNFSLVGQRQEPLNKNSNHSHVKREHLLIPKITKLGYCETLIQNKENVIQIEV